MSTIISVTFPCLKISNYLSKGENKGIPWVYSGPYGNMARIKASAALWDGKNGKEVWHSYRFVAYKDVAEKIKKMELVLGSQVSVVAEYAYESATEEDGDKLVYRILSINYVPGGKISTKGYASTPATKKDNPYDDPFIKN